MTKKKLIEVALPLEKINAESAREKSIRHGHPSTLHLWWARRPLAAARAVIWSSLVDDPSSHPEQFPTEEDQNKERKRLFKILEDLVVWENLNNQEVLNAAKAEILKSTNGNPPALLDPFAGGGAIPLEAQRLGLVAHAHDLNPVAVMINKAMIEIPPRFSKRPPINPNDRVSRLLDSWNNSEGLAEDVKYYAERIKYEAYKRIGHLYPSVKISPEYGGGDATAIAWIWTRTIRCPNPACTGEMPLASSFVLSSRKGKEAYIIPEIDRERKKIRYTVHKGKGIVPEAPKTARGAKFKCLFCDELVTPEYVKEEAQKGNMHSQLMAIVAEGKHGRAYISPYEEHEIVAELDKPEDYPKGQLGEDRRAIWCPLYGLNEINDLFTNRQLTMLSEFTKLAQEIQSEIERDAITAGLKDDHIPLNKGGDGAVAYAQAISVYLSFIVDKMTDYHSSVCSWHTSREILRNTFGRQGIPMVWDYAEANPFCTSTGSFSNMLDWVYKSILSLPGEGYATALQFDAQSNCGVKNVMVSTDPPYYDNIGYADLSDFFYVWMRQGLRKIYPELFGTLLVPKSEELIAAPYRHDGSKEKAKMFFEDGMLQACKMFYRYAVEDIPVTIYYAYKQSDTNEEDGRKGAASSGWETMLKAIIEAGFSITGTWPIRTEMATRAVASGTNALASSIVLVCRKRAEDAPQITRRNLVSLLRRELRPALKKLQDSNIAPVDLAQSAIGPGMGVFSRYRKVLDADGTSMSIRSALHVINEEIDLYFNEQVGDLDAMSRFCVDLYTQNAFNDIKFGDADILARAKGTSVSALASHDVVYAKAGTVHLIERTELPEKIDNNESCIWMLTQQLTQAMATGGIEACAKAVFMMIGSNAERAKDLAYRLYTIAEQKKWSTEAYAYNALVVAWPDIQSRAAMMQREKPEQMDMFAMGLLDT